jgi:hypothetical protein
MGAIEPLLCCAHSLNPHLSGESHGFIKKPSPKGGQVCIAVLMALCLKGSLSS